MANHDKYNVEALPERELQGRLIKYFANYFYVLSEVPSSCLKRRIDLLMYHYSDTTKEYPIGIELKRTSVKRGTNIAEWCLQASEYTKLIFNNQTPLVFIAPQISGWYLDEGERVAKHDVQKPYTAGSHNNVNSYLYKAHGFGELQKFYDYNKVGKFRLVINTFIIWDSLNPTFFNIEKYKQCL
jgi:hypothetical protein